MRAFARLLVVLLATAASGCQIRPTFTTGYDIQKALQPPRTSAGRLAVMRFEDTRPPRYYTTSGRTFLVYVPLIPYVTLSYERLDESVSLLSGDVQGDHAYEMPIAPPYDTYSFPISFPRAIAADLAAGGLFSAVDYVGEADPSGYDYILTGQLRATPLYSSGTSYCLGIAGVYLWFLPLPMQKTSAEVTLDMALQDTRTGDVIWRDTLAGEASRIATMYNAAIIYGSAGAFSFNLLPLQPDVTTVDRDSLFQWHFESLRRAMAAAKPRIAGALAAQ